MWHTAQIFYLKKCHSNTRTQGQSGSFFFSPNGYQEFEWAMRERGCPLHCWRITHFTLHPSVGTTITHQTWMQRSLAVCGPPPVLCCCSCVLQCWQSTKQERKRSDESHYRPESFISEAGFPHAHSSIAKSKALAPKSHRYWLGNKFNSHLH